MHKFKIYHLSLYRGKDIRSQEKSGESWNFLIRASITLKLLSIRSFSYLSWKDEWCYNFNLIKPLTFVVLCYLMSLQMTYKACVLLNLFSRIGVLLKTLILPLAPDQSIKPKWTMSRE